MDPDILNILGSKISRGQSKQVDLEVAQLHTRTVVESPLIIERAMEPGPVLLFMGGIHGDELNGIEIVRRMISSGNNKPTTGTTICIPVFNIFGFLNLSRQFPDGRDLNRVFPGSAKGSLASQFAHFFTKEIAPHVDYAVDFHTGGAARFNAPQVRCVFAEEPAFEFAKAFQAPFLINSRRIPKSFREQMHKMKKTVILFEGGKTNSFDEDVIKCGVRGALNSMHYLGMRDQPVANPIETVIIEKSKWLRASHSGIFHPLPVIGKLVKKGERLGKITDPYGEFEKKVFAPEQGYIVCFNSSPIVNKGDAIFHISQKA